MIFISRSRRRSIRVVAVAAIIGIGAASCRNQTVDQPSTGKAEASPANQPPATKPLASTRPTTSPYAALHIESLPNAHRVTDKVIAGAQPEGDDGFKALRDLGIKTIIDVDGAAPDLAAAKKYGLAYVHIPINYSTVTDEEGRAIGKAIEELPGPIYLHCHHGKHRSAAAAAVACIYNGTLSPDQGAAVLQVFGTGENYKGLWLAAREAKPLDPAELRDLKVKYVEVAKLEALPESMVGVDKTFDRIKAIQKAGWQAPANHPDFDPPHEALMLEEHFREAARLKESAARPADFREMLSSSEVRAKALGAALSGKPVDKAAADAAMKQMGASCTACHASYRD